VGTTDAEGTRIGIGFPVMLALVMAAGPLALYAISALAPFIAGDLALSPARLGALALVSYGAAAVSAWTNGRFADRFSPRTVQLWMFSASGLAVILVTLAQTQAILLLAMLISGLAQSVSNPVTNRLIAERVTAGRQGTVIGIKQSGVQIGQFLTGAMLPPLALLAGWRVGMATGLAIIVAGVVLTHREVEPRQAVPVTSRARAKRGPVDPFLVRLAIYTFSNGAMVTLVNVHLPLFAFDVVGVGAGTAGALAGVIGAVGIAGRIGWGRIVERLPDYVVALQGLAIASLVSVGLLWASANLGPVVLFVGTVVFAASALPGNAVAMFAVIRSVERERTGAATGIMMVALYLGFTVGPSLFGFLVGLTGTYVAGWSLGVVLGVVSVLALWEPGRRAGGPAR
jgi:MFS family permease